MYRISMLSLSLLVSGALHSFDNETDASKLYNELSSGSERASVLNPFFDRAQKAAITGFDTALKFIRGEEAVPQQVAVIVPEPVEYVAPIEYALPEIAVIEIEPIIDVASDAITISVVSTEPVTEIIESVAPLLPAVNVGDSVVNTIKEAVDLEQAGKILDEAGKSLESELPTEIADKLKKIAEVVAPKAPEAGKLLTDVANKIEVQNPEGAKNILEKTSDITKDASAKIFAQAEKKDPVRFAAIRNFFNACWNSQPIDFACKMFNPKAHLSAWTAMWKAGFKGALPTLWKEHKPVIAGTVVITTASAAAAYYAYKKGMFDKAKIWIAEKQEQCQAYFA